jgi:hypothetical protein
MSVSVLPNAKEGDVEKERRKGLGWKLERAFVRDDGFCLDWTTVPAIIALDEDPPGPAPTLAHEGIPLCLTYSRTSEEPGVQRLLVQRTTLEEMGYDTAHLEDDVEVVDLVTCAILELAPISASASAPTAAARSGAATATNGRSRRAGKASAPSASAASTPAPVRVKAEPVLISIPSPPAMSTPVPASSPLTIRIKPDPDRPPGTNANTSTYYRSTASATGKGNAHSATLFFSSLLSVSLLMLRQWPHRIFHIVETADFLRS